MHVNDTLFHYDDGSSSVVKHATETPVTVNLQENTIEQQVSFMNDKKKQNTN